MTIIKTLVFVLALSFSASSAFAQVSSTPTPSPSPTPEERTPPQDSTWDKIKEKSGQAFQFGKEKALEGKAAIDAARDNRGSTRWNVIADYSVFEMWVLSKYGLTLAYNPEPSVAYEFEYMKGGIGFGYFGVDIGKIGEQRFSLIRRSFGERTNFNFITGIFYDKFDITLGSDLLNTVSGNNRYQADVVKMETAGVTWGLGNRWQTKKGCIWGFDWFVVHIPLTTIKEKASFLENTTDPDKKHDVENAMHFIERFPSMGVVKVQLGLAF